MALVTFGTVGTTTLNGLLFNKQNPAADIAAALLAITNDKVNSAPQVPGAMSPGGVLQIPNRGQLVVLPGDYVVWDATGWPLLISARAAAGASFVHT